jgi:uncharacterized protein
MKGYQITFFTQQDRKHKSRALGEWLIQLAKELGLGGATLMNATEGFGDSGRLHSAHFFELADQPQAVIMTATQEQSATLFARLSIEEPGLFYVRTAVEFGVVGDESQ